MKVIDTPLAKEVFPIPKFGVKNETYFQVFSLIFLVIETITFFTTFIKLISSKHHIYILVLLVKLGLLTSLGKVIVDYIMLDNYGTFFSFYYSIFRLIVVSSAMIILGFKSMVYGIFQTVFFPNHQKRKHHFNNAFVATLLFVFSASFCIYLNYLYFLVISRKRGEKLDGDKSDKAHLSEIKSQTTEP